jgi:AcrR family transcriptional regulator
MNEAPFYVKQGDAPAKQKILVEAVRLFSERGLAGTSIRDIARATGYTNPALYKHFGSKDDLALHLFEACHTEVWTTCRAAVASASGFPARLEAYVEVWLELASTHREVVAFLSDSSRQLWPRASARVRKHTLIGLARSVVADAPAIRRRGGIPAEIGAAMLQGTVAEVTRMIQVGVLAPPPRKWKAEVARLFLNALA